QGEVHRRAVVQVQVAVVQPLPELGAGDLGGGGVLHQPVDGHAAVAVQPGGQVAHADLDVVVETGAGDAAEAGADQQIAVGGGLLAQHVLLVRPAHHRIELGPGDRNQGR